VASDHAPKLGNEDATAASIDAIIDEAGKQLVLACKAYVARLPAPCASSVEWVAECPPDRWKQNGSH
jgi:hypothetical protein